MENLNDQDLIKNLQEDKDTENSLRELILRHSGVYLHVVEQFSRTNKVPHHFQDVINDKDYKIYLSALKFNPEKGCKFSTYVGETAKWACLCSNNEAIKHYQRFGERIDNIQYGEGGEEVFYDSQKIDPEIFKKEKEERRALTLRIFMEKAEKDPDERIGKIFKLRYRGDKKVTPWRKISEEMGLSIQGCINIHNSALKKISKEIKSLHEINI